MRQRILLLSLLLLSGLTSLSAQAPANDSIAKAQVRSIKLSEQYIYAEAISSAGFHDATLAALDELRINVAYLETDQGKSKKETQETLQRLDTLYRKMTYRQLTMFKSFVYVSLNTLAGRPDEPVPAEPVAPDTPAASADTVSTTPTSPETAPQPVAPVTATDSIAPDTPSEAEFTVPDTVPDTMPDTVTDTPIATKPDTVPATKPVTAPVTLPVPTDTLPADTLPEKHQRVIGDLLALDTYEGVMLYLNAMKEDGRLMYGKMSALRRPEEAYLIIVKNGQLLTILDRGNNPRTNLKTHQPEDIRKYKGHAVIWLKVF